MTTKAKCPFNQATNQTTNHDWWPSRLNLKKLRQNSPLSTHYPLISITQKPS